VFNPSHPATRPLLAAACLAGVAATPLAAEPAPSVPVYRSVFAKYQPLRDDAAIPWRDANDTVNRIGGWRPYAREAQQAPLAAGTPPAITPATPATPAPAAASTPARGAATADPHATHRSKP